MPLADGYVDVVYWTEIVGCAIACRSAYGVAELCLIPVAFRFEALAFRRRLLVLAPYDACGTSAGVPSS